MKKLKFLLFLFVMIATAFSINKVVSDNKKADLREKRAKINYKIDNMGYWTRLAQEGVIPFNPDVKPEPAIFKGTKINARSVKITDSPDVPVTGPNSQQSENSVFVDHNNEAQVLNSNNSVSSGGGTVYGADYLYSFDIAETWEGSIYGPNGGNWGDPAVAIDNLGRWYVGYIANGGGQKVSRSDNHGQSWVASNVANAPSGWNTMCDKNHLWVDTKPGSPYENYVYDAWTDFGGTYNYEVVFKRSTNRGQTWGPKVVLSEGVNAGSHNQGVNLATGPNGEVYAVWSVYDGGALTEKAIGFCKSLDGGASFSTAVRAINNIYGIRNIGVPQNMRVNSFPSMAVDIGDGPYSGNIYVVWANRGVPGVNTGGDVDVYMMRSTDGGETWDTPVRVNQDPIGQGKKHYLPWIAVDPVTGALSVIFYDNRNTTASNRAETWVAVSYNAGETWEDFRVSDVEFKPQPIPGLADGYFGDYLGITAYNKKVYPVWTDNRSGKARTYCSPFETLFIRSPYDITSTTDHSAGIVHLGWNHEYEDGDGFIQYYIYRNDELIDSTMDKQYDDVLQDYAYLNYKITALYEDQHESMPVEIDTQYGTSITDFEPDTLIQVLDADELTAQATVDVINRGTLYSVYSYSPFTKTFSSLPEYPSAVGGGDEYINRVKISDLDNFTPYDGYKDFRNLAIHVDQGETYRITVETVNPFAGDQCAVWIDLNNNGQFEEEPVMLRADMYQKVFTGTIKIPENKMIGAYTMRVRLVGPDDALVPFGTSEFGETEDYLLVPNDSWFSFTPQHDTVQTGDTSAITFTFNGEGMEPGIYSGDLSFLITDLDTNRTSLHVVMNITNLEVEATVSEDVVCQGEQVQLFANVTGGFATLSYVWTTLSGDLISSEQNPVVTIDSTVSFVVAVHDTLMAVKYDTVMVTALDIPMVDLGPDTAFCGQVDTSSILLDAGSDGDSYLWSTGDVTQTLLLNKEKLGDFGEHMITVTVTNANGCSVKDTVMVNMKDCTSLNELTSGIKFSVYPNPNSGTFTLTVNGEEQKAKMSIKVLSMTGAVVYSESNLFLKSGLTKKIHLSSVPQGVYTLVVEGDDFIRTQKIVITK